LVLKLPVIRRYIPKSIREPFKRLYATLLSVGLARRGTFDQPEEEAEASRSVSVIVAIYDSPEVTRRCLNSIEKYGAGAEIILVDDGSRLQETIDLIQDYERRHDWIVIRHKEPMGHSRSCEAGARMAARPYLCLLNSDTVITPWSWSGAKRAFESNSRIAVTGPSTSCTCTRQCVLTARPCRHYWNDSQIWAFARKYVEAHKDSPQVDLPQIGGFAFFIRKDVWESLGGFDENLPDYGNEFELCIRLSEAGWRLVWTANSYIHHLGKASYKETRNAKTIAAQAYIVRKHGDCFGRW
jgi:GT2 family glycosyltransferase